MKTIILTDEQELFINGLTEHMETQDIRMTKYPLFYIYDKKNVWVHDEAMVDRIAFYDEYMCGLTEEQHDENDNTWKFDGNWQGEWKCEETGETMDEDDAMEKFHLRKVSLKEEEYPIADVGPFLTEQAAQAHIDSNGHHYNKPYIYVNSAWRNYEMQGLLQLLFALAGKEVPSQYK